MGPLEGRQTATTLVPSNPDPKDNENSPKYAEKN